MKVKDLKVGRLYVLGHRNKTIHASKINSFKIHEDALEREGLKADRIRKPWGIEYLHITNDFSWNNDTGTRHPIMYLGTTKEKWWCSRADWFPIKKRHWCIYKGRKMILDAWSVKHLKSLGVENEQ